MNKNTGIIVGIIILVLIGGGVYVSMNNNDAAMVEKVEMEQRITEDKKTSTEEDAMMKKDEVGTLDTNIAIPKVGVYETYSPEKIARAEMGDVVLFFHASWCPSCRGLNSDIEKNVALIPEGVSILKVDYDKEVELKKKYGVTYQHTLVQVDKDGNLIKRWSGSPKLSSLLSQIQ